MHEGGCLCGALRFHANEDPEETGYCHCLLCQKSTGAPVVAFVSFPESSFRYVNGRPVVYRSSPWGQREFCRICGTQICYRDTQDAETVDVNTATLDHPANFAPRLHLFAKDAVTWLSIDDDLPRFLGSNRSDDDA